MSSEHFRVVDPLENLRLRVALRKVAIPYYEQASAAASDLGEIVEATVKWQEKLLGPRDVLDYLQHKEAMQNAKRKKKAQLKQHLTITQRQQFERMHKMEDAGEDVLRMLRPLMIFTRVDAELVNFSESDHDQLTNCTAAPEHPGTVSTRGRKDYKLFHIIASMQAPVDEGGAATKSEIVNELKKSGGIFEHCLCSMKLFQTGELEISPGISRYAPETSISTAVDYEPLFFSADTLRMAAEKGFRLTSWKFRSPAGATYEYAVENIRDLLPLNELDKLIHEERTASKARRSATTSTLLFRQSRDITLHVFAEIVSADGFESDQLSVAYETYLPNEWQPIQPDHCDPVTGYRGETQLATARYVRSGACSIPLHLPPTQTNPMAPNWNSAFGVGWLMFFAIVACCLAALVDYNYAFWLAPMLLLLTSVWQATRVSKIAEIATSTSTSTSTSTFKHGAKASKQPHIVTAPATGTVFPVAHFSHHFRLQFTKSGDCNNETLTPPQLLLQVRGQNFWGLQNLQGYGYVNIPTQPGVHSLEVKTWKPTGGAQDQLQEFFVGMRSSLADPSFVAVPNKHLRSLNRFGLTTTSSGRVYLRLQIIVQKERSQHQSQQNQAAAMTRQLPPLTMRRSVADIVDAIRAQTQTRATQNGVTSGQSTPKASRLDVQSILAKARSRRETAE